MIALGIAIAFSAAVANAFALVLQAQEASAAPERDAARFALLWGLARRPRWVAGTALLALGWPLQILSLSFAPLTVVQPVLATFQLILLVIARFHLKQAVGRIEWFAALAVTGGVTLVIVAAPHRTIAHPAAARVAVPLVIVGLGALVAYAAGRRRPNRGFVLALGAGLGYAWVDFTDKLVSNSISAGRVITAIAWRLAVVSFGVIAFLLENSALQRQSAVRVAPVIGAIQEPLPVLMALAAGLEAWSGGAVRLLGLAAGLAVAALGAALLARSPSVAQVGRAG